MKPQRIKLVAQQVVIIPREHTSTGTHKGNLKSEVRTSLVMHRSDTQSSLVQGYQCNLPPSHYSLLSSSPSLCHSEGSWKSEQGYSSLWVQTLIFKTTHYNSSTNLINPVFIPTTSLNTTNNNQNTKFLPRGSSAFHNLITNDND